MRYWLRPGRRFGAEGMEAVCDWRSGSASRSARRSGSRFDEEDKKIVELTDDQAWVLAFVLQPRRAAVTGPAGSGKTLLALRSPSGSRPRPSHAAHLLQPAARRAPPRARRRRSAGSTSATFHHLCVQVAKEAGLDAAHGADRAGFLRTSSTVSPRRSREARGPARPPVRRDRGRRGAGLPRVVVAGACCRCIATPTTGSCTCSPTTTRTSTVARSRCPRTSGSDRSPTTSGTRRRSASSSRCSTRASRSRSRRGSERTARRDPRLRGRRGSRARLLGTVLRNLIDEEHLSIDDIVVLTPSGTGKSRLRARGEAGGLPAVRARGAGHHPRDQRPRVQGSRAPRRDPRRARRQAPRGPAPVPLRRRARGRGTTSIVLATEPVARELRIPAHRSLRRRWPVRELGRSRVLRSGLGLLAGAPRGDRPVRRRASGAHAGGAPARDRRGARDRLLRAEPVAAAPADARRSPTRSPSGRRRRPTRPPSGSTTSTPGSGASTPVTGLPYDALEPGLLLYVHACLVESALAVRAPHGRRARRARASALPRGADARRRDGADPADGDPADRPRAPRVPRRSCTTRGSCGSARPARAGRRAVPRSAAGGRVATGADGRLDARVRDAAAGAPAICTGSRSGPAGGRRCAPRSPRCAGPGRSCRRSIRFIAPYQEWRRGVAAETGAGAWRRPRARTVGIRLDGRGACATRLRAWRASTASCSTSTACSPCRGSRCPARSRPLAWLRAHRVPFRLITNTTTQTRADLATDAHATRGSTSSATRS